MVTIKCLDVHVLLNYIYIVHMWHSYMSNGHTMYARYIYTCIHQKNSAVQLTSVGLTHTYPNLSESVTEIPFLLDVFTFI